MFELHVRVSTVLGPDGERPERHAYPNLTGDTTLSICAATNTATAVLQPDDPDIPLCPLCSVFLAARDLDLDSADWKSL